jgi:hypothetical protein
LGDWAGVATGFGGVCAFTRTVAKMARLPIVATRDSFVFLRDGFAMDESAEFLFPIAVTRKGCIY